MRIYDFVAAQRPDFFIAISRAVQSRINKYYRRNSVLIYPPVPVPDTPPRHKNVKDYYILISRLYKAKGVNIAIDAFNSLGQKLIIVGKGSELKRFQKKAGPTITFLGFLNEKAKNRYLSQAKALIFPSFDEDFGIAPVEAMAHGVPVIALYSGGSKETIIDKKTGIFFHEPTPKSLIKAVRLFESLNFNPEDCYRQAKHFSEERFEKEIKKFLQVAINKKVKI
jgi:glycosyltransferase involved in cell wall biosynthesis